LPIPHNHITVPNNNDNNALGHPPTPNYPLYILTSNTIMASVIWAFYIASLGKDSIILGFPFLYIFNFAMDRQQGRLIGEVCYTDQEVR